MCGPLHAHIEATTAVRVGCMGAEDKMAGEVKRKSGLKKARFKASSLAALLAKVKARL